jgi:hypothetical protein
MWNWYEWNSEAEFNNWHSEAKIALGLPKMSVDRDGNECEPVIDSYTTAKEVDGKWIAMVESSKFDGLTQTDLRPPKPAIDLI